MPLGAVIALGLASGRILIAGRLLGHLGGSCGRTRGETSAQQSATSRDHGHASQKTATGKVERLIRLSHVVNSVRVFEAPRLKRDGDIQQIDEFRFIVLAIPTTVVLRYRSKAWPFICLNCQDERAAAPRRDYVQIKPAEPARLDLAQEIAIRLRCARSAKRWRGGRDPHPALTQPASTRHRKVNAGNPVAHAYLKT